jgi:hypothetical protein
MLFIVVQCGDEVGWRNRSIHQIPPDSTTAESLLAREAG